MKIRKHRGGLSESIATMQDIEPTFEAIQKYMQSFDGLIAYTTEEFASLKVELYDPNPDTRIAGWESGTYLITYHNANCDTRVPFGMCNEPVLPSFFKDMIKDHGDGWVSKIPDHMLESKEPLPDSIDALSRAYKKTQTGFQGQIPFKTNRTPYGKIRNACVSGHTPGQAEKCKWCREARFNSTITNDYTQSPTIVQLQAAIQYAIGMGAAGDNDLLFIQDYLGLKVTGDPVSVVEHTPVFAGIDPTHTPLSWVLARRPAVAMVGDLHSGNGSGKSHLIEQLYKSMQSFSTFITIDGLSDLNNREKRRDKATKDKADQGYVLKASPGKYKHGDKNATQFVKAVKPHPLLKGLVKKTER